MRQELIDTIGSGFSSIWKLRTSGWGTLGQAISDSLIGRVFGFIRSMIEFVFYAVKSIFNLIRNVVYAVLDGSVSIFGWLMDIFEDLSLYMGKPTSLLLSLFVVVLIILVFQFILRLLFGKYHYNKVSKK